MSNHTRRLAESSGTPSLGLERFLSDTSGMHCDSAPCKDIVDAYVVDADVVDDFDIVNRLGGEKSGDGSRGSRDPNNRRCHKLGRRW
jgi:hypothetical protein